MSTISWNSSKTSSDLAPALGGELAGQLEQALEGRVDVLRLPAGVESEAELAGLRVDGDDGRDPEPGEHAQELLRAEEDRGDVVVDRLGELLRELLLRRRGHQVDVRDEHALRDRLLRDAPDERRLAVAPRGEDDDVLSVQDVGEELRDLGLAVGERVVERERAEAEGVRRHTRKSVADSTLVLRYARVRNAELRRVVRVGARRSRRRRSRRRRRAPRGSAASA